MSGDEYRIDLRCDECGQLRFGVILRPNGKMLCNDCNLLRLRKMSPTQIWGRLEDARRGVGTSGGGAGESGTVSG